MNNKKALSLIYTFLTVDTETFEYLSFLSNNKKGDAEKEGNDDT